MRGYTVTRRMNNGYQTNHVIQVNQCFVHAECGKHTGIHLVMQWLISGSKRKNIIGSYVK
jgi:hypothetical protein